MQFLLFTLYAPMASLGEIAVGERRMGWARPGRSAVFGLVAAAHGWERTDQAAHENLEESLHYAVRTDAPGRPLMDYHTAQTPKAWRGVVHETRRQELSSADLHTVLSTREWRTDAFFTACLWPRENGTIDLFEIASALRQPHFVLYLGRKSAPLGLPLNPAVVQADTLTEAFGKRQANVEEDRVLEQVGASGKQLAFDVDPRLDVGNQEFREERRRDAVVDRERWQFTDRMERVMDVNEAQSDG